MKHLGIQMTPAPPFVFLTHSHYKLLIRILPQKLNVIRMRELLFWCSMPRKPIYTILFF